MKAIGVALRNEMNKALELGDMESAIHSARLAYGRQQSYLSKVEQLNRLLESGNIREAMLYVRQHLQMVKAWKEFRNPRFTAEEEDRSEFLLRIYYAMTQQNRERYTCPFK